jgi:hypothetical protein
MEIGEIQEIGERVVETPKLPNRAPAPRPSRAPQKVPEKTPA